jgi:AmiR/NasT family two-component response regulator
MAIIPRNSLVAKATDGAIEKTILFFEKEALEICKVIQKAKGILMK